MLNEKQVLRNIRLSDIQKEVLAKTIAAPNEDVAGDEILDGGRNYVGAKNILVRLGLMTFHDNEATITQTGHEVMKRANLIDETGQLTDEGQKYAYSDDDDQDEWDQQQQGQQQQDQQGQMGGAEQGGGVDQGPLAGTGPSFGESFSLIRSVHEHLQFKKQLNSLKNKRTNN